MNVSWFMYLCACFTHLQLHCPQFRAVAGSCAAGQEGRQLSAMAEHSLPSLSALLLLGPSQEREEGEPGVETAGQELVIRALSVLEVGQGYSTGHTQQAGGGA